MAEPVTQPSAVTGAQALALASAAGLDRLEAQWLLLHALGKPPTARAWLLAHDSDALAADVTHAFAGLCQRRAAGEPMAYITGQQEFFGLQLAVDNRVLVPRPDTETLVAWALEQLALPGMPAWPAVLDLGTGSGAIALAIAYSRLQAGQPAQITAVDTSAQALALARYNASRLGLAVEFVQGNWMQGLRQRFDLIASNPPYIASGDPHLPALRHEPVQALVSGTDGLDDIRHLIDAAPDYLLPGGWLLLEHGYDQAVRVRTLLESRGFAQVQSRQDLAGVARCSGGQWQPGLPIPTLGSRSALPGQR